mmetsp:Transcript_124602/g.398512  ORF Transcript_124602/g.398512 Transcript_124602/m.398512 type:complete len:292 (-) Transcript_124602:175-1050(-)
MGKAYILAKWNGKQPPLPIRPRMYRRLRMQTNRPHLIKGTAESEIRSTSQHKVPAEVQTMKAQADAGAIIQCDFIPVVGEVERPIGLPNVNAILRDVLFLQSLRPLIQGPRLIHARQCPLDCPSIAAPTTAVQKSVSAAQANWHTIFASPAMGSRGPPEPGPTWLVRAPGRTASGQGMVAVGGGARGVISCTASAPSQVAALSEGEVRQLRTEEQGPVEGLERLQNIAVTTHVCCIPSIEHDHNGVIQASLDQVSDINQKVQILQVRPRGVAVSPDLRILAQRSEHAHWVG